MALFPHLNAFPLFIPGGNPCKAPSLQGRRLLSFLHALRNPNQFLPGKRAGNPVKNPRVPIHPNQVVGIARYPIQVQIRRILSDKYGNDLRFPNQHQCSGIKIFGMENGQKSSLSVLIAEDTLSSQIIGSGLIVSLRQPGWVEHHFLRRGAHTLPNPN